jgi:hypothetical protein
VKHDEEMLLPLEVPLRVVDVLVRETRAPGILEAPDLDAADLYTRVIAARIVAGAIRTHAPPKEVGVARRVGRRLLDDLPTPGYPSGRQQDLVQAQLGDGALLRPEALCAGFALRGSCGRRRRPALLLTRLLLTRPAPKPLGARAVARVVGEADAAVWLLAAVDVGRSGDSQNQQASKPEQEYAIHASRIGGPAPRLDGTTH